MGCVLVRSDVYSSRKEADCQQVKAKNVQLFLGEEHDQEREDPGVPFAGRPACQAGGLLPALRRGAVPVRPRPLGGRWPAVSGLRRGTTRVGG